MDEWEEGISNLHSSNWIEALQEGWKEFAECLISRVLNYEKFIFFLF